MSDGLKIRLKDTGEIVVKSHSSALADIENGIAELVGPAESNSVRIRVKATGEECTKSRSYAQTLIARGEAELVP